MLLSATRQDTSRGSSVDREAGWTLTELAIVMVLIGILAAIAIPTFVSRKAPAYDDETTSDVRNAATLEQSYLTDHDSYVAGDPVSVLHGEGFVKSADTVSVTVFTYAPGPAQAGRTVSGAGSFCIDGRSPTGNDFVYNSVTGAITKQGACPA